MISNNVPQKLKVPSKFSRDKNGTATDDFGWNYGDTDEYLKKGIVVENIDFTGETGVKKWLPLYDVFRHLKQELDIDLNSLIRFFEGSKMTLPCY